MAKSAPQLFSGARGIIKFNGSKVAVATNISISEQYGERTTFIVGEYSPVSIDPVSYDISCSIGRIIPITKKNNAPGTPQSLDKITAVDLGFEPALNAVFSLDAVEIVIYDKNPTDPTKETIVGTVTGARFAGRSTSTGTGDISSESFNYVGTFNRGHNGDTNSITNEEGLFPTGYGV